MPGKKGHRSIKGAKYRVTTTKGGARVRLAWKGSRVIEAKNIDTGAIHTQKEFARDRKRAARRKRR
jgi:hypothetical protein